MEQAVKLKKWAAALLVCLGVLFVLPSAYAAASQDYVSILYNNRNGMPTAEANDILQDNDGFIWIASYSGLIRYDGQTFTRISNPALTSANCLLTDCEGRLWVGTNDNGVVLYYNGEATVYNQESGLTSTAVKALAEDSAGNLYVGTTSGVCVIHPDGSLQPLAGRSIRDKYIVDMAVNAQDIVLCVANDGTVFELRGEAGHSTVLAELWPGQITSVYVDAAQGLEYFGTQGSRVYMRRAGQHYADCAAIDCGGLSSINAMLHAADGRLWLCADNGVGYFETDGSVTVPPDIQLNNSVDRMMEDYEGNLWFTSSRQGVLKRTANYFISVSDRAGFGERIVNAVTRYDGIFYAGTDTGLIAWDAAGQPVENELTALVGGARTRCLTVDEDGLWLCTYGALGLVHWDGMAAEHWNEQDGIVSAKARSSLRLSTGDVYVATANGISILRNGRVIGSIDKGDGLTNLEVLTMAEMPDGRVLAGTDGGGICVLRNGSVVNVLTQADGLRSDIVMRIRYDKLQGGWWIITGNSVAFYDGEAVRTIDKFPYSNNFDLYFGNDDTLWLLSSNGIYATTSTSMLSDDAALVYTCYNYESGMPAVPTANAFSYVDAEGGVLYVAGSGSVYSFRLDMDYAGEATTRIAIPTVRLDGETVWVGENDMVDIAADVKRIRIDAQALNYTLADTVVEYSLEGFDAEPTVTRSAELGDITYTNLAGGDYTFRFSVIDQATGEVVTEDSIRLHKKTYFWRQPIFPALVLMALTLLVAFIASQIAGQKLSRVMLEQSELQNRRIRDALDKAEQASRAKTDFMSRMSHDLRTPLNGILGMAELLRGETAPLTPEAVGEERCANIREYLGQIDASGSYLLGLVNDMLDIDRIQSGRVELRPEPYSTAALAAHLHELFQPMCTEKGISLTIAQEGAPVTVMADMLRCNQIFTNLLSNAVKFTPAGGQVTFREAWHVTEDGRAEGVLCVQDTGKGMSEAFQKQMFEPFAQETVSQVEVGSGLGLTIVRQLTELMGGTLEVNSAPGQGTTFTLRLTLALARPEQAAEAEHGEGDEENQRFEGRRVLLCEDHPVNVQVAKKLLERRGIEVTVANDGAAGVKAFTESEPGFFDAVLMDIRMPVMDGLEAARAIRALARLDAKTVPILAMTANAYEEDKQKSREAGMNGHIAKPIDVKVLYRTLAQLWR